MIRVNSLLAIALLFAATLLSRLPETAGEEIASKNKPLVVITGPNSGIQTAGYFRVTSSKKLELLWQEHLTEKAKLNDHPAPAVDFARCEVVAIFQGAMFNSRGIRVESVELTNNDIVVKFDQISYQTSGESEKVSPYAFIIFSKSGKEIILQENVQQYLGQPPQWKEVARLMP
jgi:hypothetical protein